MNWSLNDHKNERIFVIWLEMRKHWAYVRHVQSCKILYILKATAACCDQLSYCKFCSSHSTLVIASHTSHTHGQKKNNDDEETQQQLE